MVLKLRSYQTELRKKLFCNINILEMFPSIQYFPDKSERQDIRVFWISLSKFLPDKFEKGTQCIPLAKNYWNWYCKRRKKALPLFDKSKYFFLFVCACVCVLPKQHIFLLVSIKCNLRGKLYGQLIYLIALMDAPYTHRHTQM